MPTLGQPGLNVVRADWARALRERGVEEVVLCYDSQPRKVKNGVPLLAPEEQWSIRHGATFMAAGLRVRVARLPLMPGEEKQEIDEYLARYGPSAFQQRIDTAPLLIDYHRSLGKTLLEQHNLPVPSTYPLRRALPRRLSIHEAHAGYGSTPAGTTEQTLAEARARIAALAEAHATVGTGILVLAHAPGAGKGHNTTIGLKAWMRNVPTGDDGSGFLVWTALRKEQINDQQGLELIPLSGRNSGNCRKLPEVSALAQRGYSVKDALCVRRCPTWTAAPTSNSLPRRATSSPRPRC